MRRTALHDQKQLVLALVMMPDELTLELRELHELSFTAPTILGLH